MSGIHPKVTDNMPNATKWLRMDLWAVDEAVCLLLNFDPSKRDGLLPRNKKLEAQYLDALDTVNRAEDNTLPITDSPTYMGVERKVYAEVDPASFIRWADSKGYEIPEPFKPLLKGSASDIPSDSLTALRGSSYWQTLEKNAIQAIETFPEWKKMQKKIQLTGNLKSWLEENITDNARELEIIKNVLSEIYKINK
tara:strand:+ start:211 stop:795 length:585 start_codon:yes stop_codon:yes gene_type:complete